MACRTTDTEIRSLVCVVVRSLPFCCCRHRRRLPVDTSSHDLVKTTSGDSVEVKIARDAALDHTTAAASTSRLLQINRGQLSTSRGTGSSNSRSGSEWKDRMWMWTIRVKRRKMENGSASRGSTKRREKSRRGNEPEILSMMAGCRRIAEKMHGLTLVTAYDRKVPTMTSRWNVGNEPFGRQVQYVDARRRREPGEATD